MQFNSLSFAVFFAVVCALMALTNTKAMSSLSAARLMRCRHIILLVASYVFYGWWNVKCCLLMLLLTLTAHFCSLRYVSTKKPVYVRIGVIFPLVILGVFKYFNFFVSSFCALFGIANAGTLSILLPVGISFYTFQSLSYTIDVYRGRVAAETDFVRTALYISFFPQLVAGPIVKAGEFIPQLYEERTISLRGIETGVQIFAFGLFKKIVLADNISVFVDAVHMNPAQFDALTLLLCAYAYAIQIYCDFSGYSDMAVGCAKCLGYELPRNFNLPYLAQNVSEFWKRWHISLSTWLQEYLYIPLGGNRKGRIKTYINLFITMTLGGLWHGASWTFVVWGALHGIALCVHKKYSELCKARGGTKESRIKTALSVFLTFTWVSFCLVVFRAESISAAASIFRGIFTLQRGMRHISSWAVIALALTAAAELAALIRSRRNGTAPNGFYPLVSLNTVKGLALFFVFAGIILGLAYTGESPFIYFQF